jgi:WD40 repeat protein
MDLRPMSFVKHSYQTDRQLMCIVAAIGAVLSGLTLTTPIVAANPPADSKLAAAPANASQMWKENFTIEYPGTLPVSVAFSDDGKTLLTGDTAGEIMALIFAGDQPQWRWKSKVEGSHAAVAFSADEKQVYATTQNGVRILDVANGKEQGRIEAKDSNPTAIGVFPNKTIAKAFTRSQIVFGTPRGYFIKSWAEGKLPDTIGTIETSTSTKDAKPAVEAAVPLAVDPQGRSAIMTGPIDATGKAGGNKGKNVLWAYVCGDYDEGSPGNRVMPGHTATVVSAAWAKKANTAITADTAGRVIVWDAKTMKEAHHLELGGRVAALAISDDGTRSAAYVLGKQGELYVWETEKPIAGMKPIHTELGDFGSPHAFASLSFSPDGRQLAGCAIDKNWLTHLGDLIGKVRVWQLSAAPKAQLPPKHAFIKRLPKGSPPSFVIPNNDSLLVPADKQGALDFRNLSDGHIQARVGLGKFTIGTMKLSTDRKWLAMEQYPPQKDAGAGLSNAQFEIGIYEAPLRHKATIPSCSRLLDIASGGKTVAVLRDNQIELWDIAATKKLKAAPFQQAQIDAAAFSPDGQLLAISDHNELILWRWEENTPERIDLGRRVASLVFSPDGKFLAEGPSAGENIQIRSVATHQIVETLANSEHQSMNIPRMVYTQGGRVLITCDNTKLPKENATPNRITLWDTADGSLAHQLKIPAGVPRTFDVSPNGRYLITMIEDSDGLNLSGWQLDGMNPTEESAPTPPATASPQ